MAEEIEEVKEDPKRIIHRKLTDIANSQQSVVEKIGQVQVDLMNNPDKELEKELGDIMTLITTNHEKLEAIADALEARLDKE